MADTSLQQLVINELTKAQYEALPLETKNSKQLFLVTDEVPLDSGDIVTAISSSSTDAKIPSAKCVYDAIFGAMEASY